MKAIDDFIEIEESKMTWLDKITLNYPKVNPTKSFVPSLERIKFDDEKIIRPAVSDKIIAVIIALFAGLFWIGFLRMLINQSSPFIVVLTGFLFMTFLIVVVVRNSFFNSRYIYKISVNHEYIAIDAHKMYWADILETCIMNKRQGRGRTNSYLVIFKADNTMEKYDLFKFAVSDQKISTIIEYYKAGNRVV